MVGPGEAWQGMARHGRAWLAAWQGTVGRGGHSGAWRGTGVFLPEAGAPARSYGPPVRTLDRKHLAGPRPYVLPMRTLKRGNLIGPNRLLRRQRRGPRGPRGFPFPRGPRLPVGSASVQIKTTSWFTSCTSKPVTK